MNPELPGIELCRLQADWLADARARLLRSAGIAQKRSLLDLGCGYGLLLSELRRRSCNFVTGFDHSHEALKNSNQTNLVCGDAAALPFRDKSFDLVFTENTLLWAKPLQKVLLQIRRVLSGACVLIEPDFGGMIEYPPEVESREIWIHAISQAGGDPHIGRKLPPILTDAGFKVRIELLSRPALPSPHRFDFLLELDLSQAHRVLIERAKDASTRLSPAAQFAHLPYFLIVADVE